jgi:hypothetical protein
LSFSKTNQTGIEIVRLDFLPIALTDLSVPGEAVFQVLFWGALFGFEPMTSTV